MRTFLVTYEETDPTCTCSACRVQGGPHVWPCTAQVSCEDGQDPAEAAEEHVRRLVASEASFKIFSVTPAPEIRIIDWTESLAAEAEALGLDDAGPVQPECLARLGEAGLRGDLDRLLVDFVHEEKRETVLVLLDQLGLQGVPVIELVAGLALSGQGDRRLYRELVRLAEKLYTFEETRRSG